MPAFDYSLVADLYDSFCRFEDDIEFFRKCLQGSTGPVLELMAGTGRISLPLLEAGVELVCVDASLPMLEVLKKKLEKGDLRAGVVCCDVRRLPFRCRFRTGIWPFHGISELDEAADRQQALRELRGVMQEDALLIITLHNPAIRQRSIDGKWHDHGTFRHLDGNGSVALSSRLEVDAEDGAIVGVQRVEQISDAGETVAVQEIPLRFALPSHPEIEAELQAVGFEVEELYGDYDASVFDDRECPHMIWKLRS
ncbi:MAG: class I SAM-dependent methyltransferase [Thermoanaerobaculia bacterium]|jgi:SAM-dependent methyltransferase